MLTVLLHLKSQSGHLISFFVVGFFVDIFNVDEYEDVDVTVDADAVNVDEYEDDDLDVNGVDADVEVVVVGVNVVDGVGVFAGDQCLQL